MAPQKFDFRVREANLDDASPIFELLKKNNYHSANLPQNLSDLRADLRWAHDSFSAFHRGENFFARNSMWLFVLEETKTKAVLGTAIVKPLRYRLIYRIQQSVDGVFFGTIAHEHNCKSVFEFGGFLLDVSVRGLGLGKILSLSRGIFLTMADAPVRTLATQFMLEDVGRGFWERWCAERAALSHFEAELASRIPERVVKLRDTLLERIVFSAEERVVIETRKIRKESEPARAMLVKHLGFSPTMKLDMTGCLWYETSADDMKRKVVSARVAFPADRRGISREVIVAWRSAGGFEARYAPLAQGEDGETIVIADGHYRDIPEFAEFFAF